MKRMVFFGLAAVGVASVLLGPTLARAASKAEKAAAVQKGLTWLTSTQLPDGSFRAGSSYETSFASAATASAVQVLAEADRVLYAPQINAGLNFILNRASTLPLTQAGAPNDPSNYFGAGKTGVRWVGGSEGGEANYVVGLVMPAITAAKTPNAVIAGGPLNGWTHQQVVQGMVDYIAWGQNDTSNYGGTKECGGWGYTANVARSDNSVSQWPALGLIYAENYGLTVPQFVKNELAIWADAIQRPDGGSDYDGTWGSSLGRTGGLVIENMVTDGQGGDLAKALAFMNTNWKTDSHFGGNAYTMWSVYKGLETALGTDNTTTILNLNPNPGDLDPDQVWNWWEDQCNFLVNFQRASGYWDEYSWIGSRVMATAFYLNILRQVEIPEPPEPGGIPEPASVVIWGSMIALAVAVTRWRRKRN